MVHVHRAILFGLSVICAFKAQTHTTLKPLTAPWSSFLVQHTHKPPSISDFPELQGFAFNLSYYFSSLYAFNPIKITVVKTGKGIKYYRTNPNATQVEDKLNNCNWIDLLGSVWFVHMCSFFQCFSQCQQVTKQCANNLLHVKTCCRSF